jgi:DNA-binding IclR family transcriptional regulator
MPTRRQPTLRETDPRRAQPPRRGTIQSVDRAAEILKALANGRRLGVSELARGLGLPAPTIHGLLRTLRDHGFVEQDRSSEKYQLGAALLHLGSSYLDFNELRARSIVHADRLATRADAAVRVGVLHGGSVLVIHHVFRPDGTLQIPEVGAQLPLHASALGKAMLAVTPADVRAQLLGAELVRLTSHTLDRVRLAIELDDVRLRGVARERGEAVLGEASIAAAILDADGHLAGAIGIVGESRRLLPRGLARGLATAVRAAADGVAGELAPGAWRAGDVPG